MELSEHNMYAFAKLVDGDYQNHFSEKCSKFTMAVGFILPRKCIVRQYEAFIRIFLLSHSMFSIMVSSERDCMELANVFQNINAQIEGDLFELNSNDNTHT